MEPVNYQETNTSELHDNIEHCITKAKEAKDQIKLISTTLKEQLQANSNYALLSEEIKGKQKERTQLRMKLIKEDEVLGQMDFKLKQAREEKKMQQLNLSDYLSAYESTTGKGIFTTSKGESLQLLKTITVQL